MKKWDGILLCAMVAGMLAISFFPGGAVYADSIYADFSKPEYQSNDYLNANWNVEDQSTGQLYQNDTNKFFGIENGALRIFPTAQEVRALYIPSFTLVKGATYQVYAAVSRASYTSAGYRLGIELFSNQTMTLVQEDGTNFTNQYPYASEEQKNQPILIDSASLNSWYLGNEAGIASESWNTANAPSPMEFTFVVKDLKDRDGNSIPSTSSLKLYFAINGTNTGSNAYPDRKTGLSLISIQESSPVSVSYTGQGSVFVNGAAVASDSKSELIETGAPVTIAFSPANGYQVTKATYAGQEYPVENNQLSVNMTPAFSIPGVLEMLPGLLLKIGRERKTLPCLSPLRYRI